MPYFSSPPDPSVQAAAETPEKDGDIDGSAAASDPMDVDKEDARAAPAPFWEVPLGMTPMVEAEVAAACAQEAVMAERDAESKRQADMRNALESYVEKSNAGLHMCFFPLVFVRFSCFSLDESCLW